MGINNKPGRLEMSHGNSYLWKRLWLLIAFFSIGLASMACDINLKVSDGYVKNVYSVTTYRHAHESVHSY